MSKIVSSFISLFVAFLGMGQAKYPISQIPAELTQNVDAVIRQDEMIFTIHSLNKATLRASYAVTIYNSSAQHYAHVVQWYNKHRKLINLQIQVYNSSGELIKKVKTSEIVDRSAFDGMTLHTDTRLKTADASHPQFPYTVECEYEFEFNYLFYIDGTNILSRNNVSVQKASYELIYPQHLTPRYKAYNTNQEPKKTSLKGDITSLRWSFENLPPLKFEPYCDRSKQYIKIDAAPGDFDFDGYTGSMKTWDEFGQWILSLNKDRDNLTEETKLKIKTLTATTTSREEKIKILYEYLQSKTRYVGIQMGIGGYQPFDATVVDQTGYGDCKALSNYMVAMLQEVGIKANYALIRAGDNKVFDEDFPCSQFNHATVAVPNGADTVWLECTSQTNPFGYQGKFTGDRKALIITNNGAKVVNTTKYPAHKNIQSRSAEVVLAIDGNANAKVKTSYSGLQYENDHLNFILNDQFDDQKEWVEENTQIPSFQVESFKIENHKARLPSATVKLNLTLNRLANVSGKRMFLNVNLMNRENDVPGKVESRKTQVTLDYPYIDYDTITYNLPENLYPEFVPENIKYTSRFGEYEAQFKIDQNKLIYIRKMKMNDGTYPPESYNELIEFKKNINKADNTKVVFMSKT